jgi:hypothetical protein
MKVWKRWRKKKLLERMKKLEKEKLEHLMKN